MKLKKYSDIFEGKDKKIKNRKGYIEDVFVRLEDCGYKADVFSFTKDDDDYDEDEAVFILSGEEPFFRIDIKLKDQETSDMALPGGFTSMDDYFQFNVIMKRILDQLSHDYNIDCFDIDRDEYDEGYYVILSTK